MGNREPGDVAQSILTNSEALALRSTKLSEMLEAAERFLRNLPAKVSVSVGLGEPKTLSFEKQRGEWRLVFQKLLGDEITEETVTDSSIDVKAEAAALLPELLERVDDLTRSRLTKVDEALQSLNESPFFKNGETF